MASSKKTCEKATSHRKAWVSKQILARASPAENILRETAMFSTTVWVVLTVSTNRHGCCKSVSK
eukprot:1870299-Amphidinium_carterae.1